MHSFVCLPLALSFLSDERHRTWRKCTLSNDVMIHASGLSKRFGSTRALDKVSFEVRKGEVVGFLGPNGAGKSTAMRILTCYLSASAGSERARARCSMSRSLFAASSVLAAARRCTVT